MEGRLPKKRRPVWRSLTGAHPGLFTSENKNALTSSLKSRLESIREKLKMEQVFSFETNVSLMFYLFYFVGVVQVQTF